ncbi:hydroxyisourate hydrolase [Streptomyces sp. XM83C]|uniref:Hydroxyisourate hydrolase n=1 Tax=Streptomyces thermocoprophilus TaxID=78356 RepID=A0ABV5VJ51_9ACTN|nr:hydroxyisourate hydrolase [Streptomyces sp. XM83C]MCK1822299.1 hydroxyisourate hydrolase [Streptomyces sp. XM83C]
MTISVRVLDTTGGRPVSGLPVSLYRRSDSGTWSRLARVRTDARGHVRSFTDRPLPGGSYRLVFATGDHFGDQGADALYTEIILTLQYPGDAARLHVPLFLSPFSHSTCRGNPRSTPHPALTT